MRYLIPVEFWLTRTGGRMREPAANAAGSTTAGSGARCPHGGDV